MKIYISGISGTGMGPLALMAAEAGMEVFGSDLNKGAIYDELIKAGVEVSIGEQDGKFLKEKLEEGVGWFIYTSALPKDSPEYLLAKKATRNRVLMSKRDAFTDWMFTNLGLNLVAVAGTHGKTTTTAMIVWACLKLGIPVSYIVGTTLGFAPSGKFDPASDFVIYEADEYDRNFLKFNPWLAVITSVSYDHPDIYPTWDDYVNAFREFMSQSKQVLDARDSDPSYREKFKLAGEARRADAQTAGATVGMMARALGRPVSEKKVIEVLNEFPGVGRRFERLSDGIYTDYAHHPEEIEATMDVALDECRMKDLKGVVAVYQPHQNTRQHEVQRGYRKAFSGAEKIYWLPTYLTREDESLPILTPGELIVGLKNAEKAEAAVLNDGLFAEILKWRDEGYLVLLMTAGPADGWLREKVAGLKQLADGK